MVYYAEEKDAILLVLSAVLVAGPLCIDPCITFVTHVVVYLLVKFEATKDGDYIFTIVFLPNEVRDCHEVIHEHLMEKASPAQLSHIFYKILNVSSPKSFARYFQYYTTNIWKALTDYEGRCREGQEAGLEGGTLFRLRRKHH